MNRKEVIEGALLEAEQALREVVKKRQELDWQERVLSREVEGLKLAMSAWSDGDGFKTSLVEEVPQLPTPDEWQNLPRTSAILRVMRLGEPIHLRELVNRLRSTGRTADSAKYVSAALAYLKKNNRVVSRGDGIWELNPSPLRSGLEPEPHVSGEAIENPGG